MWFYFALLSALFNAFGSVARRTHGSLAQPAELAWWTALFSLPLSIGLLLASNEPWWTNPAYIGPALVASALNAWGAILLFRAYKYGDASAVSPVSNLLPIALVVMSFIVLGAVPKPLALLGILLVVGGVYYSSVSGKHSLFYPVRQLFKNKGSKAMLGWVGLMTLSTILMKIALVSASASYLLFFQMAAEFVILSVYLLCRPQRKRVKHGERVLKRWGWHLGAIAVFTTLSVFFQLQAMHLIDPSYVLAVKRIDVLLTVLLAGLFLREHHIFRRLKGSAVAVAGVAIIYIFS